SSPRAWWDRFHSRRGWQWSDLSFLVSYPRASDRPDCEKKGNQAKPIPPRNPPSGVGRNTRSTVRHARAGGRPSADIPPAGQPMDSRLCGNDGWAPQPTFAWPFTTLVAMAIMEEISLRLA